MKKIFLLLLVLFLVGCGQVEQKHTRIFFYRNPDGGEKIQAVYGGITVRPIKPVLVFVEWWWHDPNFNNVNIALKREMFCIESNEDFLVWFAAPYGSYLIKEFWVKVMWEDETGAHEINSNRAVCTVEGYWPASPTASSNITGYYLSF